MGADSPTLALPRPQPPEHHPGWGWLLSPFAVSVVVGSAVGFMGLPVAAVVASLAGLTVVLYRPVLILPLALLVPSGHFLQVARIPVGAGYFTGIQALGLLLLPLALWRVAAIGRAYHASRSLAFPVAWALALFGSSLFAEETLDALYWTLGSGLALVGLTLGLIVARRSPFSSQVPAWTMALLASALIVEGIVGRPLLLDLYTQYAPSVTLGGPGFRPLATVANPLVASSGLLILLAYHAGKPERSRLMNVAMSFAVIALAFSKSRSSIVGLLLVLAAWFLAHQMRAQRLRVIRWMGAVTGSVAILGLAWTELRDRGSSVLATRSDQLRIENLAQAIELPGPVGNITGLGAGSGKANLALSSTGPSPTGAAIDNQYVSIWVETGIFGLLFVSAALLYVVWSRGEPARLPMSGIWGLAAWLYVGLFFDVLYHDVMMVLLAWLLAGTFSTGYAPAEHGRVAAKWPR